MPICANMNLDGKLRTDGKNVLWYNVPIGGFGDTTAPTITNPHS